MWTSFQHRGRLQIHPVLKKSPMYTLILDGTLLENPGNLAKELYETGGLVYAGVFFLFIIFSATGDGIYLASRQTY